MNYPEPDAALIGAAAENFKVANAALNATDASISVSKKALREAQIARTALIDRAAAGDDLTMAAHHEADANLRDAESGLARLREIRGLQEGRRNAAEIDCRTARGAAERPRVIHAIREIFDSGVEAAAARAALSRALERDETARSVITSAFGHGFPVPVNFPAGAMPLAEMERALGGPSASSLRAVWADLADEALGCQPS